MCHAWSHTAHSAPLALPLCHAWPHVARPLPGLCATCGCMTRAPPASHAWLVYTGLPNALGRPHQHQQRFARPPRRQPRPLHPPQREAKHSSSFGQRDGGGVGGGGGEGAGGGGGRG
eukprot:scaffold103346_cov116-Phaeocystis_antarctica.AAC.1